MCEIIDGFRKAQEMSPAQIFMWKFGQIIDWRSPSLLGNYVSAILISTLIFVTEEDIDGIEK